MLFFPSGIPKPIRVQGAFISDKEVSEVVDYLKEQNGQTEYNDKLSEHILGGESSENGGTSSANDLDDYFVETANAILEGIFALITPVITLTDGRCVAIIKCSPAALAICARRQIAVSTSFEATIIKSASSSTIITICGNFSYFGSFDSSISEIFSL